MPIPAFLIPLLAAKAGAGAAAASGTAAALGGAGAAAGALAAKAGAATLGSALPSITSGMQAGPFATFAQRQLGQSAIAAPQMAQGLSKQQLFQSLLQRMQPQQGQSQQQQFEQPYLTALPPLPVSRLGRY